MDDLEIRINKDLYQVVTNVAEWAKDLLCTYIQERIYRWGEEQKESALMDYGQHPFYAEGTGEATGQLLNSIVLEPMLMGAITNYVGYTIFSDPSKMSYSGEDYIHGTPSTDYRAVLLERLNEAMDDYGKARYPWWANKTDPHGRYHFFDDYLQELNEYIYKQFEKEMANVGWAYRKEGYVPDEDIFDA